MSCWTKEELEQMLFDVVNELDLSDGMIEEHGPHGTAPAILVRQVLAQKDRQIAMLQRGFVDVRHAAQQRHEPDTTQDVAVTLTCEKCGTTAELPKVGKEKEFISIIPATNWQLWPFRLCPKCDPKSEQALRSGGETSNSHE